MRFILVLIMLFGNTFAFEIKEENKKINISYEILDGKYLTSNKYIFDDNTDIMIKFKKVTPQLISDFENRYNLELQEVLVIGFYRYKINSDLLGVLSNLIEEDNIQTVKPNWKKTMQKR